jgi:hypothetical protein
MKIIYLLICTCLIFSSLSAGETDPFFAVNEDINDSKNLINKYMNNSIYEIVYQYNNEFKNKNSSCEDVALFIMQELGTTNYFFKRVGSLNSDFEIWVDSNKNIDRAPIYGYDSDKYVKNSIYAPKLKFFGIWTKSLDSTINIGDVYLGIDKLSHFLGSGYEYYSRYLKVKRDSLSNYTAEFNAIKFGLEMEKSILGSWSVGIFSYADLEANYQGLKMAKDFCSKSKLRYINGNWKIAKAFKIEDYVNPAWDEVYNPNSYTKNREKKIRDNISRLSLCKKIDWINYHRRLEKYEEWSKKDLFKLSLSNALLSMLKEKVVLKKREMYREIVKHYGVKWSYKELIEYFGSLNDNTKTISLQEYCQVK